ncbi:MAG: hypothetical protein VW911_00735 [Pelagibacteraceae bacterium]|jgi:hypothetical protein
MSITLTNILLFFILVTLLSYYFIPWKNFEKAGTAILLRFWCIMLVITSFVLILINFIFSKFLI